MAIKRNGVATSRHAFEVATQNAVESKTARSQHGTEIATHNLLRGQTNMIATKINIASNINEVATGITMSKKLLGRDLMSTSRQENKQTGKFESCPA